MYSILLHKLPQVTIITTLLLGSVSYGGDLYRFQEKTYTEDQLPPQLTQTLYEAKLNYYQEVERLVAEQILHDQLEIDAKKANKTVAQMRSDLFKAIEISEKELKQFYQDNKERIPYEYKKAKHQLTHYLQAQKRSARRDAYIAKAKAAGKYQLLLSKPIAPVFTINTQGFPSKGNGKVTVVEFFDYKCGYCREASIVMRQIVSRFKDKVRFVYIDYPLSPGTATIVAQGAYCASNQNKYWQYHYLAFDQQANLNAKSPDQLATILKLDSKKFSSCMAGKAPQSFVARGKSEAQRLGVSGTPTFFVNGRKLIFDNLSNDLAAAINAELAAKGKQAL